MLFLNYFNFAFASLGDITFSLENTKIISKKELIPNKKNNSLVQQQKKLTKNLDSEYYVYIVKKGDNLFKISKKFGVPLQKLIEINNLFESSIIRIGQKILIPLVKTLNINGLPLLYAAPYPQEYIEALTPLNENLIAPVSGYNWGVLHFYNAIDIASPCENPVYAAHSGVVESIGFQNNGYGYYIILKNNNFSTLYAHLSKILVEKGSLVNQGDLIGLVGKTGFATGCHLHFETRNIPNPLFKNQP